MFKSDFDKMQGVDAIKTCEDCGIIELFYFNYIFSNFIIRITTKTEFKI